MAFHCETDIWMKAFSLFSFFFQGRGFNFSERASVLPTKDFLHYVLFDSPKHVLSPETSLFWWVSFCLSTLKGLFSLTFIVFGLKKSVFSIQLPRFWQHVHEVTNHETVSVFLKLSVIFSQRCTHMCRFWQMWT